MAAMSGPFAMAQQGQYQPGPSQHGSESGQYGAPPQHMGTGPRTQEHAGPQAPPGQQNYGYSTHKASHGAPNHQVYSSGRQWHHGDYYHGNRYVVRDWQHYHLRQPPYGYEWVQDGDQFVLIAIATGIITDVILNAMNQ
jgi:Ni/Co efflux regulator RcnB